MLKYVQVQLYLDNGQFTIVSNNCVYSCYKTQNLSSLVLKTLLVKDSIFTVSFLCLFDGFSFPLASLDEAPHSQVA